METQYELLYKEYHVLSLYVVFLGTGDSVTNKDSELYKS